MQFDKEYKGFSFSKEGPLDMRMNPSDTLTAKEIINKWPEDLLGKIFLEFGEEPRWRQAAKAIVAARRKQSIETTIQLSNVICAMSQGRGKLHPATLIFQALRIAVNSELDVLSEGLSKAMNLLSPEGRIGVISFHSLEDRIVKNIFRTASTPIRQGKEKLEPMMKLLTKKPLIPSVKEIRLNPRARSAKLRFAQRTGS